MHGQPPGPQKSGHEMPCWGKARTAVSIHGMQAVPCKFDNQHTTVYPLSKADCCYNMCSVAEKGKILCGTQGGGLEGRGGA